MSTDAADLVPLFIDDRDGSSDLAVYPFARHAEMCRLDFGDVLIVGRGPADATTLFAVEVKSIWDLVGSINSGRLQGTQLPGLIRTYDVPALLYYGAHRSRKDGSLEVLRRNGRWEPMRFGKRTVPYGYLEAFLWDVSMLGVHIKRAETEREAADWLGVMHRWWSKSWDKHHGMRTLDRSREVSLMPNMDPATLQRVKVASQLPGVGFEKAMLAAAHFGSVRDMVNASAEEWTAVRGIGKVIAKAVVEAVR